jgi:riboflavin synthase
MFTGVVEGLAKIESISKVKGENKLANTILKVRLGKLSKSLKVGNSVNISGACLTITKLYKGYAHFEIVNETIQRTYLGDLKPGDRVNVERSLQLGDRLEGHIVLGHVDCTARIEDIVRFPKETKIWIKIKDPELLRSVVPKGSIAVDGISLTVVDVEENKVSIVLIPHTLSLTTLGFKSQGDSVNIEIDVISRYVISNLPKL